jgi:hypothetical protein
MTDGRGQQERQTLCDLGVFARDLILWATMTYVPHPQKSLRARQNPHFSKLTMRSRASRRCSLGGSAG